MKKIRHIIVCLLMFIETVILSSCTVNIGMLVAPKYDEHDWYCEELQITCLNEEFHGAGYALMEYNGKSFTREHYSLIDVLFENISKTNFEETYSIIQGFIDHDGNFYLIYSECGSAFDEHLNEYVWEITFSQELLIGDVKNHGSYIAVTIETDNLYNGEYVGKTIRFDKM